MISNKLVDFKLYLITDRKIFVDTPHLLGGVEGGLKAGVKAIQLREKDLPTRDLLDMGNRMRELTAQYDALLFINDRVDIAMSVRADGVHLGQTSIPVHAVRNMMDDKFLIGASTHTLDEALAAEKEGADFVTFGPVYRTASKVKYGEPVGIESLKRVKERLQLPIFGIGGIRPDLVKEVLSAGAFGIAVISGILGDRDIEGAAGRYLRVTEENLYFRSGLSGSGE